MLYPLVGVSHVSFVEDGHVLYHQGGARAVLQVQQGTVHPTEPTKRSTL